ncbi:MAG: TetR/AcrR family transcriptional regulator [Candidatus Aminicenantes bacterium]|nr:TetR/AcrR family transcriptional regulator [Candidatus Aminicenantes bacterium]
MSAIIVDKEAKKEKIIKAAIQVFARKGFARTTISDVAMEANIGKGTVYEYFSTKEELIHEGFSYFVRALGFDFSVVLASSQAADKKLAGIFRLLVKMIQSDDQGFIELIFDVWAEGMKSSASKKPILNELKNFYKEYGKLLEEILKDGIRDKSFRPDIKPRLVSSVLIGMMDGVMIQWLLDKKNFNMEGAVEAMIVTILKGIRRE